MNLFGVYLISSWLATIWVAYDARRLDWRSNGFCDRVWKWILGCLFLFGIAFPAYLWQRRKMPAYRSTAAIVAAVPVAASDSPVPWSADFSTPVHASPAPSSPPFSSSASLTHAPVSPVREVGSGSVPLALLAGAAVALIGGLLWAGVVIATRFDIGFLAWFVGATTGLVIVRAAGRPVGRALGVVAGLLAAGGIIVGKYVIFVHDVKKTFGTVLARHGISVGYLDSRQMSIFIHNFSSIVRPIYGLWVLFAFVAAIRAAEGKNTLPSRPRR